jgi:uncharacterized protein
VTVLELARAATAALERSRQRIDDLNVYPVPDGDTGTNLMLTARAVVAALEKSDAADRESLAREATRAALMGARGNSGVILSQLVRGAAEALAASDEVDAAAIARALRGASDAGYRAVREPVEGTMLTVIRELAEEAEARPSIDVDELFAALVRRADEAVERTQQQLDVLREAGVVDAGAAGLAEIFRGIAAALAGESLPEPAQLEPLSAEAVHQELSRYRYCTAFVIEGDALDAAGVERDLEALGDSLLVVGDREALKVHVHTDDPGAALAVGTGVGMVEAVEIANMHLQTEEREQRLLQAVPHSDNRTDVVAVVTGDGNRRLFESLGAAQTVDGGQTMNPATAELAAAVSATGAPEAVLLPNNPNVILAAEQAAELAGKPVRVIPTRSLQAGLAAMVAFDGTRTADENEAAMRETAERVATGAVTVASRDVRVNGSQVVEGSFLGLLEGEPRVGGSSFDDVARAVVERLLAEPRDVLTILTGADEPKIGALVEELRELHPELEIEVQEGGQPHYSLLLSAE